MHRIVLLLALGALVAYGERWTKCSNHTMISSSADLPRLSAARLYRIGRSVSDHEDDLSRSTLMQQYRLGKR